jgi:hypothetical protein
MTWLQAFLWPFNWLASQFWRAVASYHRLRKRLLPFEVWLQWHWQLHRRAVQGKPMLWRAVLWSIFIAAFGLTLAMMIPAGFIGAWRKKKNPGR